jgi:DNA invertase Pin-like site-specific DNA recombinase
MVICIHLRVSSAGQDARSQEPDLRTWAFAQAEPVTWYRDKFTVTQIERPGLGRLLVDARAGTIRKVCVWLLDRLGRTAKELLTLLEELQALGVGFVSLREGFDRATPLGRLMPGVLAAVAAYESEVHRKRQPAGIARTMGDVKCCGRQRPGTRVLRALTLISLSEVFTSRRFGP